MSGRLAALRRDARAILQAAVRACDPGDLLTRALDRPQPLDRAPTIHVVAAGKGSAAMTETFLARFGDRVRAVVVAAPGERARVADNVSWHVAGHPVPDAASVAAGRAALALAERAASSGTPLVVLLSGGASAMMEAPVDGLHLDDIVAVSTALSRAGADIADLNAVRKHLSAIKGGRLAARAGLSVTYALSDVHAPIPDDPAVIGSGPTVGDPSTFSAAVEAIQRAGMETRVPARVRELLARGVRGDGEETIKPGDARLAGASFCLIGNRTDAIEGAAAEAERRGYRVTRIEAPVIGAADAAASRFLDAAADAAGRSGRPACVIGAGETTVVVHGHGLGGRNQQFVLAAVPRLATLPNAVLASLGTDGTDGPTDAAGAMADTDTAVMARGQALEPSAFLDANDAWHFFHALDSLIVTGPTGTNVGDVQVALVGAPEAGS